VSTIATRRAIGVLLAAALCAPTGIHGSAPPGQNIAPVYEGWYQNADGTYDLVFGYYNRNWEEIDAPIGPHNTIEPGGPDRGQPTRFYPRRMRFLFRVTVPKDFGNKEVVWTLTTNGRTERAYATLKPDYIIDKGVFQANSGESSGANLHNVAPALRVEGESGRRTKVGAPLALTAVATDDGVPKASPMRPPGFGATNIPQGATGLRFAWFVYRGAGTVTFDPPQISVWEDLREGRNSPHSPGWVTPPVPPGGKWDVRATFDAPGTYVLRALAHDGGLSTSQDITVVVEK
jgi:hypothetical protein